MNSMNGSMGPAGRSLQGGSAGNIIAKGYDYGRIKNFTPEQMQLFKQLFSQVSPDSYLSKLAGGDASLFEEMERPAMRQFQELQGQNASRFSGAGMGARRGSGFQNSQNQATSDFAMDLQSRRQELMRQAILDLMGISGSLLGQRPYDQFLTPKPQKQSGSGWGGFLGGALGGIGGLLTGGPGAALAGSQIGYHAGSAF